MEGAPIGIKGRGRLTALGTFCWLGFDCTGLPLPQILEINHLPAKSPSLS